MVAISQNGNLLSKWGGAMGDEKRSYLAEDIIFKYKYEPSSKIDSALNILYNHCKGADDQLKAWTHYIHSEIEKARSNLQFAMAHADSCISLNNSDYLLAKVYGEKAKLYTTLNELGSALEHYQLALNLSKKSDFVILESQIFANMGEFYRKTADFNLAFDYLDSAQLIVEANNIYAEVNIDILDRKAALYTQTGHLDSTVYFSRLALAMAIDQQNLHAQGVSHNELGYYFEHLPNFDSSYFHYNRAIQIWTQIEALRYLASAQFNKSRLLIKDGKTAEAKSLLLTTEKMGNGKNWYELYPGLYGQIAGIYQQEGDSLNYYKYLYKIERANSDLFNIENEKKLVQLQFASETNKNLELIENQTLLIQEKDELIIQSANKIKMMKVVAASISLVTLFLLILLYRLKKRK
jgi:tetratricopeptide (TPR) repeat protein